MLGAAAGPLRLESRNQHGGWGFKTSLRNAMFGHDEFLLLTANEEFKVRSLEQEQVSKSFYNETKM